MDECQMTPFSYEAKEVKLGICVKISRFLYKTRILI
jgi:hypothetical protein